MKLSEYITSWLLGSIGAALLLGGAAGWWFTQTYQDRFFAGVQVADQDLSSLTREEAARLLSSTHPQPPAYTITISVDDIAVSSSSTQLQARYDYDHALSQAYQKGRQGTVLERLRDIIQLRQRGSTVELPIVYETEKLENFTSLLSDLVNIEGATPAATLATSGAPASLTISPGKIGRAVKATELQQTITKISAGSDLTLIAPVASTSAVLDEQQQTAGLERAQKFVHQAVVFENPAENVVLRLSDQDLVSLLSFPEGYQEAKMAAVLANWAQQVNRSPQDAVFEYDSETLAVTTFQPHRNGLELDLEQTQEQLVAALEHIESQLSEASQEAVVTEPLPLALQTKEPELTLAETNDLGINELIGFGDSEYDHSIPTRIHNVDRTAEIINYKIIPPGEEFSFNKALGEVSRRTGFQPAYVIKNGRTELGDGGGVCQVSTTLFRSVLNAGLPVTKRKAHSYRVSYYELNAKPGIDATVYAGDVDLRFQNDTGHHVLLYFETDSENLYMTTEIYGTSDGRTTEIVDHKTWDFRPAPAPVFIPDPSLPPGRRRQIDWAVAGIKASFKNIVRDRNGNVIREEEYYSNYVPWSAKYLVGM